MPGQSEPYGQLNCAIGIAGRQPFLSGPANLALSLTVVCRKSRSAKWLLTWQRLRPVARLQKWPLVEPRSATFDKSNVVCSRARALAAENRSKWVRLILMPMGQGAL